MWVSLLTLSYQFPRIHESQWSLSVVDSGQYSADKVTRMKIFVTPQYVMMSENDDLVIDFL